MSIILFEAIQRDSRKRQRTNARYKAYLAELIVHLCFPLNKFSVFYQIQSKGGFAIHARKQRQTKKNYNHQKVVVLLFKNEIYATKYKVTTTEEAFFITITSVGWIDIFTRLN